LARTEKKTGGKKIRYTYIFATNQHQLITKFSELKGWGSNCLGFFLNGKAIGHGELQRISGKYKYVHTDAMGLNDDMRRKGHGIHLYFAMIRTAKKLGADRIYSSRNLNKYSGNMWCNKLREFFEVLGPKKKKSCSCKCRRCRYQWGRYYINLTKLSFRSIPR